MEMMRYKTKSITIITIALACGLLALVYPSWRADLHAQGHYATVVIIKSDVSVIGAPELTLNLVAQANKPAHVLGPLTGQGTAGPVPARRDKGQISRSTFSLTGQVNGDWVFLSGAVERSTDPELVGSQVLILANERTSIIMLRFGDIVLQGIGSVRIR